MPPSHARDTGLSRRSWLLAGLALALFSARAASPLTIVYEGDDLRPVVPNLHFLTGKPLERLHDAEKVVFGSWLSLYTIDAKRPVQAGAGVVRGELRHLGEEVHGHRSGSGAAVSGEHDGPSARRAWCLDNMAVSAAGLAADRPFFLRLELRTEQRREFSSVLDDPGLSLIEAAAELIGRKPRPRRAPLGALRERPAASFRTGAHAGRGRHG